MQTEIGEFIVGAYLKLVKGCDIVDYNIRPKVKGLAGLAEIDVLGLEFHKKRAYLCEVTTHLEGTMYGKGYGDTIKRIVGKHKRQKEFAERHLSTFEEIIYMFWSPRIPKGKLLAELRKIETLELVINNDYRMAVEELRELAKKSTRDEGNPFFRSLQIIEHLRK
jgi:hypothetical protein